MSYWQIYLVSKLTLIQIAFGICALFALLMGLAFLIEGKDQAKKTHGGLEDPTFVRAQQTRYVGFRCMMIAIICLILFLLIPSSGTMCQMIPQCPTAMK
jgi:hypothetical protein